MRNAFLEFLVAEGTIAPARIDQVRAALRTVPEPIGSIAFSYGLIRCEDIDEILDEQRQSHEPFGEVAIRRGLLRRNQLETLLHVQRMRAANEVAEALALSGMCPVGEVLDKLGRFLTREAGTILCGQT